MVRINIFHWSCHVKGDVRTEQYREFKHRIGNNVNWKRWNRLYFNSRSLNGPWISLNYNQTRDRAEQTCGNEQLYFSYLLRPQMGDFTATENENQTA